MSLKRILILSCLVTIGSICLMATSIQAQSKNPTASPRDDQPQTLQQLLAEVRELRITAQRATYNQTRFQMLIERLKIEQAHADSVRHDLDGIHAQLSELQSAKPRIDQQRKDTEELLARTVDLNARGEMESRIMMMKSEFGRISAEAQRLHNRESELENEIQMAQTKLNELNGQLDMLMNETKAP